MLSGLLETPQAAPFKVLIVKACGTGGYVHGTINQGTPFLMKWGADKGTYTADTANDATVFTKANLAKYSVIILNNNTNFGGLLNSADQRAAFLEFMNTKGVIGLHGANDTHATWKDYDDAIGGTFSSHGVDHADLNIEAAEKNHPINAGLEATYNYREEWYAFNSDPRKVAGVHVLYTLNEATCPSCVKMGGDHPVSYYRQFAGGGRYYYSIIGHSGSFFNTPGMFATQVYNAILWASQSGIVGVKDRSGKADDADAAYSGKAPEIKAATSGLTVSFSTRGGHTVEVLSLSGKRMASRQGTGARSYAFTGLATHAVYAVITQSPLGRDRRLVTVP